MAGINNKQLVIMRPCGENFGINGEQSGYVKSEERSGRLLVQFGVQNLKHLRGTYHTALLGAEAQLCGAIVPDAYGSGFLRCELSQRPQTKAYGVFYEENGFIYSVLLGHRCGGNQWQAQFESEICKLLSARPGSGYTSWEYKNDVSERTPTTPEQTQAEKAPTTPEEAQASKANVPDFAALQEAPVSAEKPASAQTLREYVEQKAPDTYYECNEEYLERLLQDNEPAENMNELIPGSRWVKVEYSDGGEHGHYILGIIYDGNEKPLYICYGVPAVFSEQPPENLGENCQWIPKLCNEPRGNGYWVIYQQASTGERVKI